MFVLKSVSSALSVVYVPRVVRRQCMPLFGSFPLSEFKNNAALLLVGHGTRDADGLAECRALAKRVSEAGNVAVEVGFIELAKPTIGEAFDRLVERALRMDGTCSGEHGVGQGKIRYLAQEHGAGVEMMIAIKKALDPLNILNPGKIFALP